LLPPIPFKNSTWDWRRPYLAGVLNVTPDSFSDGGLYLDPEAAVTRGVELAAAGADLIDVGGESTRPGAPAVPAELEVARVETVIRALAARVTVPIAVDTTKATVARAALGAGAEVVNDISGGVFDPAMVELLVDSGAAYVCGHLRGNSLAEAHAAEGTPPTFAEVSAELSARLLRLPPSVLRRTIADPGLGFGKGVELNLELCARAGELSAELSCAVMVGPSRKRFLGLLTGAPVHGRDAATIGAALAAVAGGAHVVRVHDVPAVRPALSVFLAVRRGAPR
jgi:dihydropteroate synthase